MAKREVITRSVFLVSIFATVVAASVNAFSPCNIMKRPWARLLVAVALVGTLVLAVQPSTYLPFLGPTVMPVSVLRAGVPSDASTTFTVDAPGEALYVVYWAARSGVLSTDPETAYGNFENAGMVEVVGGKAILRVKCPGTYNVMGSALPKHVHYRFVYKTGMLSEVKTAHLKC